MSTGVLLQPEVVRFLRDNVASGHQLESLLKSLATPPATTIRVNQLVTNSSRLVDTLNNLRTLDEVAHGRFELHDLFPELVVTYVGTGVDLGDLPSAEEPLPKVLLDCRCAEAVLRGAPAFLPGVLAVEQAAQPGGLVLLFADLHGLCSRGAKKILSPEKIQFLGRGRLHRSRKEIFHPEQGFKTGVAATLIRSTGTGASQPPPGIWSRQEGIQTQMTLQNLPSIVTALCVAPDPGDKVIDICAAPGGKTGHLGEMMGNAGSITALDKNERKVQLVKNTVERLGLENVTVLCRDATKLDQMEFVPGTYDRVLCDPPCTGLGLRPRLSNTDLREKDLMTVPTLQRKLLKSASDLLRPGGRLVYSTCTLSPLENEDNVVWALANLPLSLIAPSLRLSSLFHSGLSRPESTEALAAMMIRCHPDSSLSYDTPGFFVACFNKQ